MSILFESTAVGPPPTELYGEIPILLESATVEPPPSTTEQLDGPTTTVAKETTTVEVLSALTDLKFPSSYPPPAPYKLTLKTTISNDHVYFKNVSCGS